MRVLGFLLIACLGQQAFAAYSLGGGLVRYDRMGAGFEKPIVQAKYFGVINPRMNLGATFQWTESPKTGSSGVVTYSAFSSLLIESNYVHRSRELGPYGGGKVGLVFVDSKVQVAGIETGGNNSTALGVGFQAGYMIPVMKDFSINPEFSLLSVRTKDAHTLGSLTINATLLWK